MKLSAIRIHAIDYLKTNSFGLPIYRYLKTRQLKKRFSINEISKFTPVRSESEQVRFNLVLPSLRKTKVFAGVSTALYFFQKLTENEKYCRIVVMGDEAYDNNFTYQIEEYSRAQVGHRSNKELFFYSDCDTIDIAANDLFIFTSWKTAFSFRSIVKWQKDAFNIQDRKSIYLIQDFEPGFFSWSSEYMLAESTYSTNPNDIIAVFNSSELASYFTMNGYCFFQEYWFKPNLNKALKRRLLDSIDKSGNARKKRILIYGRPSEQRNAFEIIRYSLELWSETYEHAADWEIFSLGEGFMNITLANNTIVSKGKLSLDEYADYMLSSYAGISLMASPHPSYPPLEMSTFGIRTITNKFASKDLGTFNENIISIDSCSPEEIARILARLCDEFCSYEPKFQLNHEYLDGNSLDCTIMQAKRALLEKL